MSAMAKYSPRPSDYKKIALNLKKRFRNATEAERQTREGVAKGVSGLGGAALAAFASGSASKWARENGRADPLSIGAAGFPVMALVGLGVAGSSLLIKKNPKQAPNLKASVASAGTHIAAGALYKFVHDYAAK